MKFIAYQDQQNYCRISFKPNKVRSKCLKSSALQQYWGKYRVCINTEYYVQSSVNGRSLPSKLWAPGWREMKLAKPLDTVALHILESRSVIAAADRWLGNILRYLHCKAIREQTPYGRLSTIAYLLGEINASCWLRVSALSLSLAAAANVYCTKQSACLRTCVSQTAYLIRRAPDRRHMANKPSYWLSTWAPRSNLK
jgi:hypothetical protein